MTKAKFKADISKEDRQYLIDHGFVEGSPRTIPENISPVLKSQLLQEMGYPGDGSSPNAADRNPPDGHATGYVGSKPEEQTEASKAAKTDKKQNNGGQQEALSKTGKK